MTLYFLSQVKMDIKDSVTLKDCIDITIGTIPLRENFAELGGGDTLNVGQIELTVDSDLTAVVIILPNYPDLRKLTITLHTYVYLYSILV